jgi:transcriptional antiterminator RfaH
MSFSLSDQIRGAPGADEPRWYACHTRARHEKKIEQLLEQRGFESYLPTVSRTRLWKDRRKEVLFAMFPGYVFARFALDDLPRVLSVPGVATVIRHNGQPAPIAAEELENVRRFAEAAAGVLEQEPRLTPLPETGSTVRIAAGPFRGIEAVVVEHRGRARVLVGLNAIGQGVEIDLDASVLEQVLS